MTCPRFFLVCAIGWLSVSAVFPQAVLSQEEKYLLRYRFHEGDTLCWNVVQTIRVTTTINDLTEKLETSSRSTKIWKVKELSVDGTALFEYGIRDVVMSHKQSGKDAMSFDSRQDAKIPARFKIVADSVGVPLSHISINARGETLKKLPLRPYASGTEENKITIPLPEHPVAVGDIWTFPVQPPIELPRPNGTVKKVNARQRFTLESVKTGLATIRFETQVLTPLDDPQDKIKLINHLAKGTFQFDIDAGRTISQDSTIDERVSGYSGDASTHHNQTRLEECCCGYKTCEICRDAQVAGP